MYISTYSHMYICHLRNTLHLLPDYVCHLWVEILFVLFINALQIPNQRSGTHLLYK